MGAQDYLGLRPRRTWRHRAAAHNAWAEAFRLMDASQREEVTALKAEADALFAVATEELQMASTARA